MLPNGLLPLILAPSEGRDRTAIIPEGLLPRIRVGLVDIHTERYGGQQQHAFLSAATPCPTRRVVSRNTRLQACTLQPHEPLHGTDEPLCPRVVGSIPSADTWPHFVFQPSFAGYHVLLLSPERDDKRTGVLTGQVPACLSVAPTYPRCFWLTGSSLVGACRALQASPHNHAWTPGGGGATAVVPTDVVALPFHDPSQEVLWGTYRK